MLFPDDFYDRVTAAYRQLQQELMDDRGSAVHWTGTLAPSALSTATAVSALALVRKACFENQTHPENETNASPVARSFEPERLERLIQRGLEWLARNQNHDGGFGDTDRSLSNVATTALVMAAWRITGWDKENPHAAERVGQAFERMGSFAGLRARYGIDKTFVVPILTNCALAGIVPWDEVAQLPFPAACLPQSWYRFMQLPVVSYAIPALVAIGQVRFYHKPTRIPVLRSLYRAAIPSSLRVLERMQPASGGYLEATPLTCFVLMSLASMNRHHHPVARLAIKFLEDSALADGSWPIDTNLATWLTSLAIGGMHWPRIKSHDKGVNDTATNGDNLANAASQNASQNTVRWLLRCQYQERHPFTGADPYGWGWSDLSGAVPDGDDTPAALIAIKKWSEFYGVGAIDGKRISEVAARGVGWLLNLQNRDGGWPTFCRGWGKLPFDRSGSDLTAHAMRAIHLWNDQLPSSLSRRAAKSMERGLQYLKRTQRSDGSWVPLWFGNHHEPGEENPYYGTGKVLIALGECGFGNERMAAKGVDYLLSRQNLDGGWGGGDDLADWLNRNGFAAKTAAGVPITSSVEETATALEGLVAVGVLERQSRAIIDAFQNLEVALGTCRMAEGWPIGFYFAKLWYYERLYPRLFALAALGRLRQEFAVQNRMSANLSVSAGK